MHVMLGYSVDVDLGPRCTESPETVVIYGSVDLVYVLLPWTAVIVIGRQGSPTGTNLTSCGSLLTLVDIYLCFPFC